MTPERWARVTELFDDVCQQPAETREAWLLGACDDGDVRGEVRAMLEAYDTDPGYLEQPVDPAGAVRQAVADTLVGRRLGAYRLTRQIGHGGMGVVYEAQRDDQEFDRTAAVKILPAWSAGFAERFRMERRVLAALDHPGIARLIDSGTTDDGIAWFVMEYVDGQPVTTWCAARQLPFAERIALVAGICDAVAYAHRHLVVHRDLKPANILVTGDGQPKLLDFGIATLLAEEGGASTGTTRTGHQSFTPEFASPEQIRGERVTTASDVYSLGVLLYLVLTGRHPYALQGLSPLEVMHTVCEIDPPAPSSVAPSDSGRALAGDLDAVVGKALRKLPGERYASVAELAVDLRAWGSGHPVMAAPASVGYRARRFIGRHRMAVAAAVAVVLAISAGGVATAWQARIAQTERDKAQNRFRQVQEFSRSLLFEVHGALIPVPGATEARRLLLDRAVQFLDGLAADAGDDDQVKLELSSGYQQLANVQGNQLSENVGDSAAAVVSLQKAMGLADEVRARQPEAIEPLLRAVRAASDLAAVLTARADAGARQAQSRHESLVRELQRRDTSGRWALTVARGFSDMGRFHTENEEFEAAEVAYREAVRQYELAPREGRKLPEIRDNAYALKRLGGVLMRRDELEESERRYREALALDREALALDDRPQTRYDMTFTLSDLALIESRRGLWAEAVVLWNQALEIRKAISDADPKNVRALNGVATLNGRLGGAARAAKDFAAAMERYREELTIRLALRERMGDLPAPRAGRAWAALRLAEALTSRASAEARNPARASWLAEARGLVQGVKRSDGEASVPAGSEPGFVELYDALTTRLGH
ncbi:MAG: protein kinase [Acidobacteria bacterium]|nr:protein kinase [Acidobacteriota bacterium]